MAAACSVEYAILHLQSKTTWPPGMASPGTVSLLYRNCGILESYLMFRLSCNHQVLLDNLVTRNGSKRTSIGTGDTSPAVAQLATSKSTAQRCQTVPSTLSVVIKHQPKQHHTPIPAGQQRQRLQAYNLLLCHTHHTAIEVPGNSTIANR